MQEKVESAKAELILKIINIYDDYLRALDTIENSTCSPGIVDGLNGILKNIETLLKHWAPLIPQIDFLSSHPFHFALVSSMLRSPSRP